MKNKNNYAKQSMPYVILLLVIVGSLVFFRLSQYEVHDLSYDKFMTELQNGEVKKIEITPKNGAGVYYITGSLDGYKSTETFTVNIPLSEGVLDKVMKYVDEDNNIIKMNPDDKGRVKDINNPQYKRYIELNTAEAAQDASKPDKWYIKTKNAIIEAITKFIAKIKSFFS